MLRLALARSRVYMTFALRSLGISHYVEQACPCSWVEGRFRRRAVYSKVCYYRAVLPDPIESRSWYARGAGHKNRRAGCVSLLRCISRRFP